MKKQSRLSSASGASLIEILAAVGLFSIIAVAVAVANLTFLKGGREIKSRTVRDQIVSNLRIYATDKKSILLSAKKPGNEAFFNCLCGLGTCANMQQPFVPFTLYDTANMIQSPAFYNSEGLPCNIATSQCQIRVQTTFFAQCRPDLASGNQNPPLSCNGVPAEFLAILYTVDENPTFTASSKDTAQLRAISGPAYVQVADVYAEVCL